MSGETTKPIDDLTENVAISTLTAVVQSWYKTDGWSAHLAVEEAKSRAGAALGAMPAWMTDPKQDPKTAAAVCRVLLRAISEGENAEASNWAQAAVKTSQEPQFQFLDPLTLSIGGAILIGAILAARVRKIGPVEFYKGVPKELAEVMKAVPRPPIS